MVTVKMGDENMIDLGESNLVFPHLGLSAFSAVD
jgi:hypothetical protein